MSNQKESERLSNNIARLWTQIGALGVPGEINTASNTGSSGTGVFKQKAGVDLEFYKLNSIHAGITIALDGTDKLDFDLDESSIDHNSLLNYLASEHFTMLDEDDFASDSDTEAATQQSIKAFVESSLSSFFDYFLTDTASGIGGYFDLVDMDLGGGESTFSEAGVGQGDDQIIDSWATMSGEPGANTLVAGLYDCHFHAEKTSGGGGKSLQFYWTLSSITDLGGVETLRMTSEVSGPVVAKTGLVLHASLVSDVELNISDRLILKIYANVGAVGGNIDLAVYAEGTNDSHITIPITTSFLSSLFVRRDGTVDLTGNWTIATNSITLSAGTLTARVLAAGDASNLGTLNLWDGSDHKQVVQTQALAADINFLLPPIIDAGKYLKCGVAGVHEWDTPAGGGGGTFIGNTDTPGAFTFGRVLVNEAQDALIFDNDFNPNVPPAAPNALDDEFEGAGAIDVKWTKVNDPAGGDALNQTDFDGFLKVGLLELGTDNFDNTVRLYQTPPTGTAAMSFIIRCSMAVITNASRRAEFCSINVYLANFANDEFISSNLQCLDAWGVQFSGNVGNNEDNGSGGFASLANSYAVQLTPSGFLYLKLEKTTTNDYDGVNTYNTYFSHDGIIWHQTGNDTKTFTANCDEVGIMFRRPSSQTGTPKVEAIVDFFRRVV